MYAIRSYYAGDEVLIPSPYWVSYPAMVQLAEGESVFVPTTAEAGYLVTVAGLEAVITSYSIHYTKLYDAPN